MSYYWQGEAGLSQPKAHPQWPHPLQQGFTSQLLNTRGLGDNSVPTTTLHIYVKRGFTSACVWIDHTRQPVSWHSCEPVPSLCSTSSQSQEEGTLLYWGCAQQNTDTVDFSILLVTRLTTWTFLGIQTPEMVPSFALVPLSGGTYASVFLINVQWCCGPGPHSTEQGRILWFSDLTNRKEMSQCCSLVFVSLGGPGTQLCQ